MISMFSRLELPMNDISLVCCVKRSDPRMFRAVSSSKSPLHFDARDRKSISEIDISHDIASHLEHAILYEYSDGPPFRYGAQGIWPS